MNSFTAVDIFAQKPISPYHEAGAYEFLWAQKGATVKTLADLFRDNPEAVPSDLVHGQNLEKFIAYFKDAITKANIENYGVLVNGTIDYPNWLRDAVHPIELLYYQGDLNLLYTPKRIAVVGSRVPSEEGKARARKLTKYLVEDGYTIFSGLAKGIDSEAHNTAINHGGKTVAVIGTPISEFYPRENEMLQRKIANEYLLISQVPFYRYYNQNFQSNRLFFPERNATMSALSLATVIVEASDTSGTLIQARAALKQGRKLFILESCFHNPKITWPARFEKQGAIRVREIEDITRVLNSEIDTDN